MTMDAFKKKIFQFLHRQTVTPCRSSGESNVPYFFNWLKSYFKLLALALILMSSLRALWFFTYRQGNEHHEHLFDLFHAFWLGLRFDFSALSYLSLISLIPWFFWLKFGSNKNYALILKWQRRLWLLMLTLLGLVLYGDFTYYGFFQDHFNALIFGFFQDDTLALLKTFWKNYPIIKIILITIFFIIMTNSWMKRIWSEDLNLSPIYGSNNKNRVLLTLLILSFSIGARGTLGLFPLEIMHTAISSQPLINTLSFNGAHALVRAIQLYDQQHQKWNENLIQLGYDSNPEISFKDFIESNKAFQLSSDNSKFPTHSNLSNFNTASPYYYQKTSHKSSFTPPHVLLIIMESWGSDWLTKNSPQMDILGEFEVHKKSDFYTPFLFPSSMATIGSLGSLMVDLPHRFYSPFLTESQFLGVPFSTAPARLYQNQGYKTHFIYGGNLGWRSIDRFLPRQGFQFLHGDNAIKDKYRNITDVNLLHEWGVFDQYVFEYAFDLLKHSQEPQFLVILTTSNHPPYTLPQNFQSPLEKAFTPDLEKNLIGDLALAKSRLKTLQYSNQQLGHFLTNLKKSSLSDQTIVAATGDHSFYIKPYQQLEFFEKWCVPFYLYIPPPYIPNYSKPSFSKASFKSGNDKSNSSKPQDNNLSLSLGSHIDIFPTLYNLSFSDLTFKSLGHDLLNPNIKPWSYHTTSWSSFDENYGIIISPRGHIISSLCRSDKNNPFEPCTSFSPHQALQKRLLSLMGVSDFIYEQERKDSLNSK